MDFMMQLLPIFFYWIKIKIVLSNSASPPCGLLGRHTNVASTGRSVGRSSGSNTSMLRAARQMVQLSRTLWQLPSLWQNESGYWIEPST